MVLTKVFDGILKTDTYLGHFDLSGYQKYSLLLRVDNVTSHTDPLRLITYQGDVQVYAHDFIPTNGWYTYPVVHDIFHPEVSFIFNTWNNQAKVQLWMYATCCGEKKTMKSLSVVGSKKIDFTESFKNQKIIQRKNR